jgi:hypothetical protein
MSTATKPARRELKFDTLDEVVRDAENLLARGYDRAGNWDLAQCCSHLAKWMRFPIDGFPKPPLPIRALLWVLRHTVGRAKFREFVETGRMPAGKPTLRETVAPPGGDPAAAVAKLREAVARFQAHAGPVYPSPLFGAMTKDEATRVQLVHAAHHLSFLVPRQG